MLALFCGVPKALCTAMAESIAHQLGNSQYEDSEGGVCWYQHVNKNQAVRFLGHTVTVEGERCALWGDHHAEALRMLEQSGIEPTVYETSDRRLKWYETLRDFMYKRAPYEVALKHCRETQGNPHYYKSLRGLALQAERLQLFPERVYAELIDRQLKQVREVLPLI